MSDWSSDVCSSDLDAVVFDHRVGEQLGAHRVEIGLAGAVGDVELDEAPRAHVRHAAEPQPLERMMDRLALRVEHPRLARPIDIHFQDRKSVVYGKSVSVRVVPGGCRTVKKKK